MSHIHKILVPMDESPCSVAALSEAVTLAQELGADIDVLSVITPDRPREGSSVPTAVGSPAQPGQPFEEALAAASGRLGQRLGRRTESGEPVRKILDVAASGHFDLVVMGTHGRVGRLHALLGSVAEGVMRSSPCPVLTVREPSGEQESFGERVHGRPALADQLPRSR